MTCLAILYFAMLAKTMIGIFYPAICNPGEPPHLCVFPKLPNGEALRYESARSFLFSLQSAAAALGQLALPMRHFARRYYNYVCEMERNRCRFKACTPKSPAFVAADALVDIYAYVSADSVERGYFRGDPQAEHSALVLAARNIRRAPAVLPPCCRCRGGLRHSWALSRCTAAAWLMASTRR